MVNISPVRDTVCAFALSLSENGGKESREREDKKKVEKLIARLRRVPFDRSNVA